MVPGKLWKETKQGMRKVKIPILREGFFILIYCFMLHISVLGLLQQSIINWVILKTTGIYCLSVLEAGSPKLKCRQVGFYWGLWGRICSMSLYELLVALGIPGLRGTLFQSSIFTRLFYKTASHWIRASSTMTSF